MSSRQGTARPTTRSISARTSRSTMPGRLASSHCFSSGRSSARTMILDGRSAAVNLGGALRRQSAHQRPDRSRCRRRGLRRHQGRGGRRCRCHKCLDHRGRRRPWRRGDGQRLWRRDSVGRCNRVGQHHRRIQLQHPIIDAGCQGRGGRRRRPPPPPGCGGSRPGCPPSMDRRPPTVDPLATDPPIDPPRRHWLGCVRTRSCVWLPYTACVSGPAGRWRNHPAQTTCS